MLVVAILTIELEERPDKLHLWLECTACVFQRQDSYSRHSLHTYGGVMNRIDSSCRVFIRLIMVRTVCRGG